MLGNVSSGPHCVIPLCLSVWLSADYSFTFFPSRKWKLVRSVVFFSMKMKGFLSKTPSLSPPAKV